jgi:hypothetical protein
MGNGIGIDPEAAGIRHLSSVPERPDTELGPLILVPHWFRHRHFCFFRYRTDWFPDI